VSKLDSYNPSRAKLEMTSLNSHSAGIYFGTRYMVLSAWRGGKENPHRHYADGGAEKRDVEKSEPYAHPIVLLLHTRCQRKIGTSDSVWSLKNE